MKNKLENYKKEVLENGVEKLKASKKRIKRFAIITLTGAIGVSVLAGGSAYAYIKSNTNYSQAQLEKEALKKMPGEIVGVKKDIDDDTMSISYEFKIKDKNNMLNEIELDSKTGAIIDIEKHGDDEVDENENENKLNVESKYSEEELKKVALNKVQGEIIGVDKEIEDDMSLVYEFKIKDKNNVIKEVEVSSMTGKIVDIENYNSDYTNDDLN